MVIRKTCLRRFCDHCSISIILLLCSACVRFGPYVDPEEPDSIPSGPGVFSGEAGYFTLAGPAEKAATDKDQVDSPMGNVGVLNLSCDIVFDHFDGIEHAVIRHDIMLPNTKHGAVGMQLVSQTPDYEFWVIPHDFETIAGQQLINDFQVAIKHKASQLFMQALSDSSNSREIEPGKSSISLVDHDPETNREKGMLVFECRQKQPD